jgi:hypothetical protein
MEERREQFECSYCGRKFNFRKHAEEHEQSCPERNADHAGHRPFSPERAKEEAALDKARSGDGEHDETPEDTKIDEAVADSFPASDPPSSNAGRERN